MPSPNGVVIDHSFARSPGDLDPKITRSGKRPQMTVPIGGRAGNETINTVSDCVIRSGLAEASDDRGRTGHGVFEPVQLAASALYGVSSMGAMPMSGRKATRAAANDS